MANVEVVLPGGVKVEMEETLAAKYAEARAKDKAEREELATKYGQMKEISNAAEAKAQKALEDKEAKELAAKGEIDEVRKVMNKQLTDQLSRFREKHRDRALEAALAKRADLLKFEDPAAQQRFLDDLVSQLRPTSQYDLDADSLVIIGPDGRPVIDATSAKPMSADAHIDQWLKQRPYYQRSETSPGSGGSGSGRGGKTGPGQVTRAQIAAGEVDSSDVASGKVVVVD